MAKDLAPQELDRAQSPAVVTSLFVIGVCGLAVAFADMFGDGTAAAWGYPSAVLLGLAADSLLWCRRRAVAVCLGLVMIGSVLLLWPVMVLLLIGLFPISNSDGDALGLGLVIIGPVLMALGLLLLVVSALQWRQERRRRNTPEEP